MSGMYSIKDLLELILREGASELRLRSDKPPVMMVQGKTVSVDVPAVSNENITELFQSIATEEQTKELHSCGDIHFIYLAQNLGHFAVSAKIQREFFEVNFRNLSRGG